MREALEKKKEAKGPEAGNNSEEKQRRVRCAAL
jgi:hypothetical protein